MEESRFRISFFQNKNWKNENIILLIKWTIRHDFCTLPFWCGSFRHRKSNSMVPFWIYPSLKRWNWFEIEYKTAILRNSIRNCYSILAAWNARIWTLSFRDNTFVLMVKIEVDDTILICYRLERLKLDINWCCYQILKISF